MIIPKSGVFDRIEQSFSIFGKNIISLTLPVFLYYFIITSLFGLFMQYFSSWYLGDQFFMDLKQSLVGASSSLDIFAVLFGDSKLILLFNVYLFTSLLFLLLFIPFKLALVRSIAQFYRDETIEIKSNFAWGFKKILESFKTYWYMFSYTYLLPALVFIIFSIFFIFLDGVNNYAVFVLPFTIFILVTLVYIIYRGVKVVFSIIGAASSDDFTLKNFDSSKEVTNGNWWRIVGNIILFGFILSLGISIVSFIINSIISIIFPSELIGQLTSSINNLSLTGEIDKNYISNMLDSLDIKELMGFEVGSFLKGVFKDIFTSFKLVFTTIFMFLFFKRLELELSQKNTDKSL